MDGLRLRWCLNVLAVVAVGYAAVAAAAAAFRPYGDDDYWLDNKFKLSIPFPPPTTPQSPTTDPTEKAGAETINRFSQASGFWMEIVSNLTTFGWFVSRIYESGRSVWLVHAGASTPRADYPCCVSFLEDTRAVGSCGCLTPFTRSRVVKTITPLFTGFEELLTIRIRVRHTSFGSEVFSPLPDGLTVGWRGIYIISPPKPPPNHCGFSKQRWNLCQEQCRVIGVNGKDVPVIGNRAVSLCV